MENCSIVLLAVIQLTSIGFSIVAFITAIMYAGIIAAKLNARVGYRQMVASNGCSIILCIQSLSSLFNYSGEAKIMQAYMQPN